MPFVSRPNLMFDLNKNRKLFHKVPGQFEKLSPLSSLDVLFTVIAKTFTF